MLGDCIVSFPFSLPPFIYVWIPYPWCGSPALKITIFSLFDMKARWFHSDLRKWMMKKWTLIFKVKLLFVVVFIWVLDQLTSTENYSFDLVDVPHALLLMKNTMIQLIYPTLSFISFNISSTSILPIRFLRRHQDSPLIITHCVWSQTSLLFAHNQLYLDKKWINILRRIAGKSCTPCLIPNSHNIFFSR